MRPTKRLIKFVLTGLSIATIAWADAPALPTPPQQNAPWTPPETRLPRFMVTAARALFEQGLADPRGREYRSIRIQTSDAQGNQREVSTAGWVLPETNGAKPRFAIAWNGLVYPLLDVGGPTDLDADIARAPRARGREEAQRMIIMGRNRGGNAGQVGGDGDEASVAGLDTIHPIQVCLLLRLGRADLAEALWTRSGKSLAPDPKGSGPAPDLRSYDVSYMSIAKDFIGFRFARAVREHLAGEDARALAEFRAVEALGRAIDAKAEELGFLPGERTPGLPQTDREHHFRYIDFLDQLPDLLADQERRAAERANPPPAPAEGDKVAALIRDLDQIKSTRAGAFVNVNGVPIGPGGDSPTVKALIDLGDKAVEPLIEVVRSDDRLTRSIDFRGGGFRGRSVMRVDEVAYQALLKILKVSSLGPTTMRPDYGQPVDREALVDRIQEYWDKNKNVPMVERWYRTLADDQAGATAWLEAATSIVRPKNAPAHFAGVVIVPGPQPDGRPASRQLQGEPLREGHAPTVTELLARRVQSVLNEPENPVQGPNQAMQLANHLAVWDPDAAAPALRELSQEFRDRYAQANAQNNSVNRQSLGVWIARLANLRAQVGDPSAFDEYAEWLKTITFDPNNPFVQAFLEPFQRHPENPKLVDAADWLFNDPESPWTRMMSQKDGRTVTRLSGMMLSPMIKIPAFAKMVREIALADRAVVGKAEVRDNGNKLVVVQFADGSIMSQSSTGDQNNPEAPPVGAKADIRALDVYAWRLSASQRDAPYFNPCWPEAQRDAAIPAIIEFLKR